jgi:TDG/mug DNA glycosylase family protein
VAVVLLRPGLNLLFCGYNPSLTSDQTGHHYAHPGNRFWRVLFAAGITHRLYAPEEDAGLLELGIGFTNVYSTTYNSLRSKRFQETRRGRLRP